MVKKRVTKREIGEKHTRVRPHRNIVKTRTNIRFTETEEVEDTIEKIVAPEPEKKPRKTKKVKTEETSVVEENENNE